MILNEKLYNKNKQSLTEITMLAVSLHRERSFFLLCVHLSYTTWFSGRRQSVRGKQLFRLVIESIELRHYYWFNVKLKCR